MAHIAPDRVREFSTSTGTGNFTLTGAVTSFRAFSSVASVNDTFYYTIAALGLNEWEVGIGTYVSTNTISRNTIIASSNAGSAVNFSTGDKDVFITAPGSKFLQMDNTGSYGNFTAGTITASLSGNASTATKLETARNIGDTSFDGSSDIVPQRILYKDTRSTDFTPNTYPGVTLHLKTNTTDSLADGGTYHGVLNLMHWSDLSGGNNHQLAFTDNNNLYIRQSTSTTTWGSWTKIYDTGDAATANTASTLVLRDASGNFSAGTITASLTGAASSNVLKSGDTMTGQLISTLANNTANGGGQIYLNGATGNRIDFNTNGVAAPAVTTRSVGTKVVLFPALSSTDVDYAIGIEASTLWFSVPSSSQQFNWYAATTNIATLSGLGVLTKRGQIFNYSYENGANQDYIRISGAANTTDYHAIGNYNTNELFIQPNTYARILRGYAYTASNRKQTPADTAILIDSSNTFIAYDKGNVNIGHTTDQGYKLAVNGSFAATTKSFLIDHPTKPGKRLRYGSLEGPENGVYVRGRLTGKVIELPDYWTKLVDPDSITVQLTPIGKHQKLYVSDIKDNKVYIANDGIFAGEINCFYYVLAERCDVDKLEVEIG